MANEHGHLQDKQGSALDLAEAAGQTNGEFRDGAAYADGESRRNFLKYAGAGLALAGAAAMPGCRRPAQPIMPYAAKVPEEIIPGRPLFYATAMPLPGGGAEGLLVETHEGRPTKVEGNPLHPVNQGKSSLHAQASILSLYDPDRLKEPEVRVGGVYKAATWDDFGAWAKTHFGAFDAHKGAGLAFIVDKKTSPSRDAMAAAVKARWPEAEWVAFDALENTGAKAAHAAMCGGPAREVCDYSKAKCVVSLDRDFLMGEANSLSHARQFGAMRSPMAATDGMNRLFMVESGFSCTGSVADHRERVAPSQVAAYAVAIAQKLGLTGPVAAALSGKTAAGVNQKFVDAAAADLAANKGASIITAGASQPAWVHALCLAVNGALNNVGATVSYYATTPEWAGDSAKAMDALTKRVASGEIKTLVCLETNPVFNAGVDLKEKIKAGNCTLVTLSIEDNETVEESTWRLNGATYLESWGDVVAADGTRSVIQPMIAPLYGGKSEIETLSIILGAPKDGHEIVRGKSDEKSWKRALWDGIAGNMNGKPLSVNAGRAAEMMVNVSLAAAPTGAALEALFVETSMGDGRWANNPWLQELPDPASHVVWDNPAYMSPGTYKALGLRLPDMTDKKPTGELVEVSIGGKKMTICAWPVPGVAENTVILPLGNGRLKTGLVGTGVGFNTFAVRSGGLFAGGAASVKSLGTRYEISSTQIHGSMEGRGIVRDMDLVAFQTHAAKNGFAERTDPYGRKLNLSLAERLPTSEMTHMPATVGAYPNPFNASHREAGAAEGDATGKKPYLNPARAGKTDSPAPVYSERLQFGMSIDLSSCIGCNVCTIACQAENNIPVVGKIEVNKGREMHWIRVDRYFTGNQPDSRVNPSGMVFQPVACVQCENAPCEVVCPVNATVHGPEGHNYMVYNRCIGTRYCANNCPYKVRRFNFFDFGVTKFNGGLDDNVAGVVGESWNNKLPANQSLVPPRLRKKLDEIAKLQKNPNVTVRSRGVMEKCTYCIQRTNEAKIDVKLRATKEGKRIDLAVEGIPDGFMQTACQQACPTGAIVFGDIRDDKSKVHAAREHPRTYALLGYLNTRPRTTYMARVNNPHPSLRASVDPFAGQSVPVGEMKKHSYVDPAKAGRDGYRMSLSVLGAHS